MAGKTEGADFLIGDVGLKPKRESAKIRNSGDLDINAAVAFLDSKKDGEALRAGLDGAVTALEGLRKVGLTGEALVVLLHPKMRWTKKGHQLTHEHVEIVLDALFNRLQEYVR